MSELRYECGCLLAEAGQLILKSETPNRIVCPVHREPVAPFERPEPSSSHGVDVEVVTL